MTERWCFGKFLQVVTAGREIGSRHRAAWSIWMSLVLAAFLGLPGLALGQAKDWKAQVAADMPLLGHRNWILVVDSAYPLENASGVETIDTGADQLTVVGAVLDAIHVSRHVRPLVTMDAELPFVREEDAPGAAAYREQAGKLLKGLDVHSESHEAILKNMDEVGKTFHILVLKTNMTIPYTSVFIRLDCKYWSADQEKLLRERMSAAHAK